MGRTWRYDPDRDSDSFVDLEDGELEMRKGKTLYHCHGANKGKKIRTYKTVEAAKAAHRGMMKRKRKR